MDFFSGNISVIKTGKWFTFSLALIFQFTPLTSIAQVVDVTAAADRSDLLIGDQATIHLEIHQPPDIVLRFDDYADTLTDGIEILLQSDFDTTLLEENSAVLEATLNFLASIGVPTVGLNALIYSGGGVTVGTGLREDALPPLMELARRFTNAKGQRLVLRPVPPWPKR